ncbi:MAG: sulfate adenylyltransferase [Candidatus Heimdallarchaeota archaeon]
MPQPHGGKLINRVIEGKQKERLVSESAEMTKIEINAEILEDLQNIAYGVFSPLEGYMVQEDLESVVETKRLPTDIPWTIPITLDVAPKTIAGIKEGDDIALVRNDEVIAVMNLEQIYDFENKENVCEKVYATKEEAHPGVKAIMDCEDKLLGGKISLLNWKPERFEEYTLQPTETRALFKEKNWKTIVGFQTRNVPHLGHEYVQKTALAFVDGLFINPIIGKKKPGDFLDSVILKSYETLIENYYLKEKATMSILRTRMRYGGPKEAIHHAIVRKNFGCTHFIVGRDHAGVGNYYGLYDAHAIFDEFPDLGIEPMFFKSFFKCSKCGGVVMEGICPHGKDFRSLISGKKIRQMLIEKKPEELSEEMRPEVAAYLASQNDLFVK